MITRRRLGQFLLSTAALPLISGLPALAQSTPQRGGSLVYVLTESPTSLVALLSSDVVRGISAKVVEGLLDYDFDLNPKPQLATEWHVSPDGLTYSFKLREGVRFHDGTPFTSADVANSIRIVAANHPLGKATFANLAEVQTPSDHEVVLKLSKPAPYLLQALPADLLPIVPAHLYAEGDPRENPANNAPVGTGPFRFAEYERGSHVLLTRNEDYWREGLPYLDQVVVRIITDPGARAAAFETGEAHIGGAKVVALSDLKRLTEGTDLLLETRGKIYDAGINRIEFNLDHPIFSKAEVRQAIAHLIDKQFILDNIYHGYGTIIPGPFSPDLVTYFSEQGLPSWPLDQAKAEALLDKAGHPRGADGIRFRVTLDPRPLAEFDKLTADYVKAQLAKVGIEVTLRQQDFAAYVKRVFTDRDWEFIVNGISNNFDPTIGTQRLYWSQNFRPGVPFSNATHYVNPEVDALLEAAAVETDPEKRRQQFHRFQEVVIGDLPDIGTVSQFQFTLHNRKVHDHTTGGTGINGNFAEAWLEG